MQIGCYLSTFICPLLLLCHCLIQVRIIFHLDHSSGHLIGLPDSFLPPSHLSSTLSPEGCYQQKSCTRPFSCFIGSSSTTGEHFISDCSPDKCPLLQTHLRHRATPAILKTYSLLQAHRMVSESDFTQIMVFSAMYSYSWNHGNLCICPASSQDLFPWRSLPTFSKKLQQGRWGCSLFYVPLAARV